MILRTHLEGGDVRSVGIWWEKNHTSTFPPEVKIVTLFMVHEKKGALPGMCLEISPVTFVYVCNPMMISTCYLSDDLQHSRLGSGLVEPGCRQNCFCSEGDERECRLYFDWDSTAPC